MSDLEKESAAFVDLIRRAAQSDEISELGQVFEDMLDYAESRGIRKCIEKLRSDEAGKLHDEYMPLNDDWADWLEKELLPKEATE